MKKTVTYKNENQNMNIKCITLHCDRAFVLILAKENSTIKAEYAT